jgi:hypothetical protein
VQRCTKFAETRVGIINILRIYLQGNSTFDILGAYAKFEYKCEILHLAALGYFFKQIQNSVKFLLTPR